MAVLDHLVYGVPDVDAAIDDFERSVGVRPEFGGAHEGAGTHNALVSFGERYLELLAPDPNQPEPAGERPFAVTTTMEPAMVAFAVRPGPGETIEDLVEAMRSAGHDPGDPFAMSRSAPGGVELSWRLTLPKLTRGGVVPFLLDWGDTPHPASTVVGGVGLVELRGQSPEADLVNGILTAIGFDPFVTDGAIGLAATVRSDAGADPVDL